MNDLYQLERQLKVWKTECEEDSHSYTHYLPGSIDELVGLLESAIAVAKKPSNDVNERVKSLESVLVSVLTLSPLWMPPKDKVSCEFGDEYQALSNMRKVLVSALSNNTL